jgi:hypothetical protein
MWAWGKEKVGEGHKNATSIKWQSMQIASEGTYAAERSDVRRLNVEYLEARFLVRVTKLSVRVDAPCKYFTLLRHSNNVGPTTSQVYKL